MQKKQSHAKNKPKTTGVSPVWDKMYAGDISVLIHKSKLFVGLMADHWPGSDPLLDGRYLQLRYLKLWIPSGKRLHNYGKSPFLMGKSKSANFQ